MNASPSSLDEDGRSAILYCAEYGYASYAKELIHRGAFLEQLNEKRRTPLSIAVEEKSSNFFWISDM